MLRAINDAARISSTADALSAVTAPSGASSGGEEKSGKSPAIMIGVVVAVLAAAAGGWFFMSKGSSDPGSRRRGFSRNAGRRCAGSGQGAGGCDRSGRLAR